MADVFDIDSSGYHGHQKDYNHRSGGWVPVETNSVSRKDPRLARRDDGRKQYSPGESPHQSGRSHHRQNSEPSPGKLHESGWRSPQRLNKSSTQIYNQMQTQNYQQPPPPPMYSEYNSGYGSNTSYSHNYQQSYQQSQANMSFNQYTQQSSYPQTQNYNSGQHQQPGPPGEEYPGSWAPVPPPYNVNHPPPPPPVPRPQSVAATIHSSDSKADDLKKEAGIAQELKQQRATLIKQRDEYLRKASVLRRELEKLRIQKQELMSDKSPPRDSQRILRENAKLQLEIQNKLKSINNVVDMLSGIIGDGLKAVEEDVKTTSEDEQYNYIHYDPELHWCRVCDVFPRSAKDFLNHLHSADHRQVTQEHQLVDTPWHKLPADPELPTYKGASVKRVPIKGLQFFISATAWYCKLCDVWIGDLHCASLHLKSKNHSHNYNNFVEQNPHWETNWLKDREKAYARCAKSEAGIVPPAPEPPVINEKLKQRKLRKDKDLSFLDSSKDKKRKKKSKKRKKLDSSGSSSSSSSSDSSTEDESDKAKSIRVAMRNKMRMQAQLILNEEIGGKLEALGKLVEERNKKVVDEPPPQQESSVEDNIINQWMTVNPNNDKHILDNLKGRLKQRQEADKEKSIEAAQEQRRREREREERELKEMREREQREIEEKMREEQEREERDREERERIKEKERSRRKRRSDSRSPERYRGISRSRGRSRSRSIGRRHYARGRSPDKYKSKRDYEDDEDSYKSKKRLVSTLANRKLPFIGRMPLFKKRTDGEEKEIKKEDYEIRLSKFEPGNTARAFIPEPGVAHITRLATPVEYNPVSKINAENPPPPPKIIPEPPQISEIAPPPPIINDVVTTMEEATVEVQDMELDEAAAPLPPGVPVSEAKPLAKPAGNHLPPDFQQALNIIFPGDQSQADANLMLQYQYYGMMYPGMQMYDYTATQEEAPAEITETSAVETQPSEVKPEANPTKPPVDDKEDLAMLGIDAEDMAAQTI